MSEFLVALMGIGLFLFLFAALGHGLWVIFVAVVRVTFGTRCACCQRKYLGEKCTCRQSIASSVRGERQESSKPDVPSVPKDLEAAKRLLAFSRFNQWLSDEQFNELEQLCESLQARVLEGQHTALGVSSPSAMAASAEIVHGQSAALSTNGEEVAAVVASIVGPSAIEASSADARVPSTPKAHAHALDMEYAPPKVRPVQTPMQQRLTAGLLKSFMEQSNIRWVELISAALIVVCSVGLVISLWSTLSSTSRFFPSLVFLLATVAVHGAGQYTLRQWKLRSTSRGILHIGLMLIPLAVLVGILLSRRQGAIGQLDVFTVSIVLVGTLVYGALAVTASQSLFARRWLIPSALTIVAGISLLPINFFGERQLLHQSQTTWVLAPLILVGMSSAYAMSRSTLASSTGARSGSKRRVAGIVVQSLFAMLVPTVFWALQSRASGGVGDWWWVATGIMAATWAAWGWLASLFGPMSAKKNDDAWTESVVAAKRVSPLANSLGSSWFRVAAWFIASTCSVFLLAAIWQAGGNRSTLSVLMMGAALWWLIHGWSFQLRIGIVAGGIATFTAATFMMETLLAESPLNQATDWISLKRIAILTSVGIFATIATAIGQRFTSDVAEQVPTGFLRKYPKSSLRTVFQQLQIAGGAVIFAAAILTLVASLVPVGETPYGGNWAALLLITYGLLAIGAGIAACHLMRPWLLIRGLVPVGQGILLLGTVRLCQTSPLLEDLLTDLRPTRSWAIGTAILAVGWAVLAAVVKRIDLSKNVRALKHGPSTQLVQSQKTNIDCLCGLAAVLGIGSAVAIWTNPDHLRLAGYMGWFLPAGSIAIFLSWRRSEWREIALLMLSLWTCSVTYAIGSTYGWWHELGLASTVSLLTAVAATTSALFELAVAATGGTTPRAAIFDSKRRATAEIAVAEPISETPSAGAWITQGPYWASACLLTCSWFGLLLSLVLPAFSHIRVCLGMTSDLGVAAFLIQPFTQSSLVLVLLSCVALTAASAWVGLKHRQFFLLDTVALLPVAIALAMSAWFIPPYSLAAALWSITAMLIASELLQWFGPYRRELAANSWQKLVVPKTGFAGEEQWLPLVRGAMVFLLILGSMAIIGSCIGGRLAEQLSSAGGSWSSNAVILFVSLGPALVFGVSRWLFSIGNGEHQQVTTSTALIASIAGGSVAAFALTGGPSWPNTAIVWLQSFALITVCLAWLNMGFTSCRNFLGLNRMFSGKVSRRELFLKSMKGARWQKSEKSSWTLAVLALLAVIALCSGAAFVVVSYPIERLVGVDRLGGPLVGLAAAMTLGLVWFLFARRGASHFGLLAATLGLFSPVVAAAYSDWLIAVPARSVPAALDFEPFRMLIALWLISLAVGLGVRIAATIQGKVFSKLGEVAWVLLASVVGGLALVSTTQDPIANWPVVELSSLAFIIVLSSVASRQAWRGHVAAIAAAAGMSAWLFQSTRQAELYLLWNVLWGPTWIGLVAILAKLVVERFSVTPSLAERPVRYRWTVDQSVSLLVPLASALFSFFWIVIHSRFVAASSELYWSILSLSLAGVVLAIARLWELHTGKRGLAFYFNLVSFAMVLAASLCTSAKLPLMQTWLIWLASGLGAMAVIAGLLREMIREASMLGPALKFGSITEPEKLRHALHWMPAFHSVAALLALVPSVILVLAFEERSMRVAATILPFIGALTILPIALERRVSVFRYIGLTLISSSLVLLFWADLPSAWTVVGNEGAWIFVHRAFVAFVLLGVVYPFLSQVLRKKEDWIGPLMHVGWVSFAIGIVIGLIMLGGEASKIWNTAAASASLATKLMTIVAWAAVTARLLQFAVRPHSTDRDATEATRKLAVYFSELSLAFLCGSCYFHFPDLFSGIFVKWWPLVVFAIAMLSAGIGEWLHRIDQKIIADPIARSSLLLPIIPLAGVWWFKPEGSEWLWSDWERYSFLLLCGSSLYGLQSWLRNSIGLRTLASLLVLFSFWAFLRSHPNLQFFDHPQFWILPPALAALLFVEFNRSRLAASVVVATRYMVVLIAYLSSSAEVFLKAFEGQLWQPLLLLILALAGVAAGIVMRVRAFLYCGLAFTFIALLGMVWHAQQAIGQVWPWWAFGIATGVSLIVLLGYFEKNRPKIVVYLEQFKKWEQ